MLLHPLGLSYSLRLQRLRSLAFAMKDHLLSIWAVRIHSTAFALRWLRLLFALSNPSYAPSVLFYEISHNAVNDCRIFNCSDYGRWWFSLHCVSNPVSPGRLPIELGSLAARDSDPVV